MRNEKMISLLLALLVLLALTGCGSDSSSPVSPFVLNSTSGTTGGGGGGTTTAPTPTGSGTVLSYNLVLSITPTTGTGTTVGANSTVIATATMTDSSGNPVANQPVKFEAVEGSQFVTIDPAIVNTDSSGKAVNFLKAGASTTSANDVIIKASTSVNNQLVTAIGIFKIMRSESNIIKFITTKGPTDPDGTLNTLTATVHAVPTPAPPRTILQLVPFQILDNNGVPRSRVPVQISIYSEIGDCPVFIDSPELPVVRTVTTDDAGLGMFNAGVTLEVPEIGSENACSIIYKAEAADSNDPTKTIYSYGGFIAVLINAKQ
jgi:hypothetical protein